MIIAGMRDGLPTDKHLRGTLLHIDGERDYIWVWAPDLRREDSPPSKHVWIRPTESSPYEMLANVDRQCYCGGLLYAKVEYGLLGKRLSQLRQDLDRAEPREPDNKAMSLREVVNGLPPDNERGTMGAVKWIAQTANDHLVDIASVGSLEAWMESFPVQHTQPQKDQYDVVSLGEAVVDFVIYDDIINANRQEKADSWEQSLEQAAPRIDLPFQPGIYIMAGGSPYHVARAVRSLGGRAAFLGAVGEDMFGKFLLNQINLPNTTNTPFPQVEQCVQIVKPSGQSEGGSTRLIFSRIKDHRRAFEFITNPAADAFLTKAHIIENAKVIQHASVLHFSGHVLTHDGLTEAAMEAIDIAKKADTLVSFDVCYRAFLWNRSEETFREQVFLNHLLLRANIVKLTYEELFIFCKDPSWQQAFKRKYRDWFGLGKSHFPPFSFPLFPPLNPNEFTETHQMFVEQALELMMDMLDVKAREAKNAENDSTLQAPLLAVVTCGAGGCCWNFRGTEPFQGHGKPEEIHLEPKDSLGAGDNFIAAMLLALLVRKHESKVPGIQELTESDLQEVFVWAEQAGQHGLDHRGCSPPRGVEFRMFRPRIMAMSKAGGAA